MNDNFFTDPLDYTRLVNQTPPSEEDIAQLHISYIKLKELSKELDVRFVCTKELKNRVDERGPLLLHTYIVPSVFEGDSSYAKFT